MICIHHRPRSNRALPALLLPLLDSSNQGIKTGKNQCKFIPFKKSHLHFILVLPDTLQLSQRSAKLPRLDKFHKLQNRLRDILRPQGIGPILDFPQNARALVQLIKMKKLSKLSRS